MNAIPANRHAWIVVARRRSTPWTNARTDPDSAYASRNRTTGPTAPRRIGTGGSPSGVVNDPVAPSRTTSASQAASRIVTAARISLPPGWTGVRGHPSPTARRSSCIYNSYRQENRPLPAPVRFGRGGVRLYEVPLVAVEVEEDGDGAVRLAPRLLGEPHPACRHLVVVAPEVV